MAQSVLQERLAHVPLEPNPALVKHAEERAAIPGFARELPTRAHPRA